MSTTIDLADPSDAVLAFLSEPRLATLTTLRADGSPHVVPVGFAYDPAERLARIITLGSSRKVANIRGDGRVAVSQVDGGRWLTLEGVATVTGDPAAVARAEAAYGARYQPPRERAGRVAIEVAVVRITGRA